MRHVTCHDLSFGIAAEAGTAVATLLRLDLNSAIHEILCSNELRRRDNSNNNVLLSFFFFFETSSTSCLDRNIQKNDTPAFVISIVTTLEPRFDTSMLENAKYTTERQVPFTVLGPILADTTWRYDVTLRCHVTQVMRSPNHAALTTWSWNLQWNHATFSGKLGCYIPRMMLCLSSFRRY